MRLLGCVVEHVIEQDLFEHRCVDLASNLALGMHVYAAGIAHLPDSFMQRFSRQRPTENR